MQTFSRFDSNNEALPFLHSRNRAGNRCLTRCAVAICAMVTLGLTGALIAGDPVAAPVSTAPGQADQKTDQPPAPHSQYTVFAECQMVILPQKAMLPLVAQFNDETKTDAAWDKLQQMIDSGEATLAADLVAKGMPHQSMLSETVEEVRYATEYEPPQFPEKIPQENVVESLKAWPAITITPTAFETRKVGAKMELKVDVPNDGKWLDTTITPEHVRFLHWQKFDAGKLANGDHLNVEQPYFHSMKNSVSLRLQSGQKALLGVHKVPDTEKTFELFLLRLTATRTSEP